MNRTDKEIIIKRYQERFSAFGQDIRALASGTPQRQKTRFQVLSDVAGSLDNWDGVSVLDLGCGFADFYAYLEGLNRNIKYVGYDISPELISCAKKRFPNLNVEVRDIQEKGIPKNFDYIVSSQTFNNKLNNQDNFELVQQILSLCFPMAKKGVVFDFTTSYVDFREQHLYYYSPEKVFQFCKSLTKRVVLRHDYPLFEFAVYLYPDFNGWRRE